MLQMMDQMKFDAWGAYEWNFQGRQRMSEQYPSHDSLHDPSPSPPSQHLQTNPIVPKI